MVRGIVRQLDSRDLLAVRADDERGRPLVGAGHRIGVRILRAVRESAAEHAVEVAHALVQVLRILAVEPLGADLGAERRLLRVLRQRELVFEEALPRAADLATVQDVPLALRPLRLREPGGWDAHRVLLRLAARHEAGEVARNRPAAVDKLEADDAARGFVGKLHEFPADAPVLPRRGGERSARSRIFHEPPPVVPIAQPAGDLQLPALVPVRRERDVHRNLPCLARLEFAAEFGVERKVRVRMKVIERHPREELLDSGLLRGAVEADVPVPFVDDVVVLGVEPAGALRAAAEGVDHHVVVPRPVAVARGPLVAPDVAALAVEHRSARLHEAADVA